MADTYLTIIEDVLTAAEAPVQAALAAAGLDPLVDWFNGAPREPRESNAPYLYWDWESFGRIRDDIDEINPVDFTADVAVTLAVEGNNKGDLVTQVAQYAPVIQAAVENLDWPYAVHSLGIYPGPRSDRAASFHLVLIAFRIVGQRARGGVS